MPDREAPHRWIRPRTAQSGGKRIGVLALVPDEWEDVVMPRHQVLSRLARHFPVVWLGPTPSWRDYVHRRSSHFFAPDSFTSPSEGLEVYRPGWRRPLVYRPHLVGRYFLRSRLTYARRRLIARGATHIALYIWRDEFAEALDCVEHDINCYHIDDEYGFSEQDLPNSSREIALLKRVDQVIVHSSALMRKKGGVNPHTALVPNGVDFAAFSSPRPIPEDLAMIPGPRVGYAGVIKKQLDLGLLVRLAQARPNYSFVLVGPVMNIGAKQAQIEALKSLPNVFFLGGKPVEDLPAYEQHFDVCLLCYEVNAYTNYIYPLKLNEYLATGRPAVAAPIEALRGLDVVTLAYTDDDWLSAIDRHVNERDDEKDGMDRRIDFARQHDWNVLVDRIAGLISNALERTSARTR